MIFSLSLLHRESNIRALCFRPGISVRHRKTVLCLLFSSVVFIHFYLLHLSSNGLSCVVSLIIFSFFLPLWWVDAHSDVGPSNRDCACLRLSRVSRWDLTRHWLTSLPYSPVAGCQLVQNIPRGEGKPSLASCHQWTCVVGPNIWWIVRQHK